MKLTIDASVFVAGARTAEDTHLSSRRFLKEVRSQAVEVFCPLLVLPECAAAIARATADVELAEELVLLIESFPQLRLVPIDPHLTRRAVRIATTYRLRGADSVYAAVAEAYDATLIAWDAEMLERGSGIVTTMTPSAWTKGPVANE